MKSTLALFLLFFSTTAFAQSAPQSVAPAPDSQAAVTPKRITVGGTVINTRIIERGLYMTPGFHDELGVGLALLLC